jgi:CrcB protein
VTVLMVLLGGAVGAPLRYVTDLAVRSRVDSVFPWGTLTVNVAGSLLLGVAAALVLGLDLPAWVLVLVGTGLCGALTTFSTFGYETLRLLEDGAVGTALGNAVVSVTAGLAACAGGWWVTTALL